ncbi:hypothetical protein [Marinilactibacillus piezotolerans]|uniref:hypothetical protein n=1 Tax=Marinilactibacillus piezotolerans TaxID=258723 RepID=UPI0009AF3693|nr:hypothetical protein [Marinilactibacillus piezotolerans]
MKNIVGSSIQLSTRSERYSPIGKYLFSCLPDFFALTYIHTGFYTLTQFVLPEHKSGQLMTAFTTLKSTMELATVAAVSGLGNFGNIRLVLIETELVMVGIFIIIFRYSDIIKLNRLKNPEKTKKDGLDRLS